MSERLIVIVLNGIARSGKDTAAKWLEAQFDFFRVAQGDAIRAILFNLMMPSWEVLKEVEAAGGNHIDPLQKLGGECKEDLDRPQLWTDVTLAAIRYISHYHPMPRRRIVISGMRYQVESHRLREMIEGRWGGICRTWKLSRGVAGLKGDRANHASEVESAKVACDMIFPNDGSKGDLYYLLNRYVGDLLEAQ